MLGSTENQMVAAVNRFIENNTPLASAGKGDEVGLRLLNQRKSVLAEAENLKRVLADLGAALCAFQKDVLRAQEEDAVTMANAISNEKTVTAPVRSGKAGTPQLSSTMFPKLNEHINPAVAHSSPGSGVNPTSMITNTPTSTTTNTAPTHWTLVQKKPVKPQQQIGQKYSKINITPLISISAISVPNFESVRQDGNLYYVTSADHFAFKIANQMFHGNIGTVYTDTKDPQKIKNCKYVDGCTKNQCMYYHNPTIFPHSKDCRNFISSSFAYADPVSARAKSQCRHFGSRVNLDTDIVTVGEEEAERLQDQAMHDLLCSIALSEN